jgi:hypothetical protein
VATTAGASFRLIHRLTRVNIAEDTGEVQLMDWKMLEARDSALFA